MVNPINQRLAEALDKVPAAPLMEALGEVQPSGPVLVEAALEEAPMEVLEEALP